MSRVLHFALALVVVTLLALLVSRDRKNIRIRFVIQLLVIEVVLAWFSLTPKLAWDLLKGFRTCSKNYSSTRRKGQASSLAI